MVYDCQGDRWLRVEGKLGPGAVFNDPGVAILGDLGVVAQCRVVSRQGAADPAAAVQFRQDEICTRLSAPMTQTKLVRGKRLFSALKVSAV